MRPWSCLQEHEAAECNPSSALPTYRFSGNAVGGCIVINTIEEHLLCKRIAGDLFLARRAEGDPLLHTLEVIQLVQQDIPNGEDI